MPNVFIDNITSQLLYTELIIQDVTLTKAPNSAYSPNFQRHQQLNEHLETIIRWFDLFFAIPLDLYVGMTFAFWCHMAHGLLSLYRLYVLDDPAWDRAAVHARLDLFALCDRLAAILDDTAARRAGQPHTEEDMFAKFAKMVRSMRTGWLAEVQAVDWRASNDHSRQPQGQWPGHGMGVSAEMAGGFADGVNTASMPMPTMMMSDDAWMQDIFNVSLMQ